MDNNCQINKKEKKMAGHKKIAVLVDGVEFESIGKAAEYLEVVPALVSFALRKKTYNVKGFRVEYKNPEDAASSKSYRIPVLVTNPVTGTQHNFESCVAAARFIGADSTTVAAALRRNSSMVKGYKIEKGTEILSSKHTGGKVTNLLATKRGVKVVASNGTSFKSIKQSAAYLNMPSWELVHALRKDGEFRKNGVIYTAVDPARVRNMKPKEEIAVVETITPEAIQKPDTISGVQLAKNLLKEKIAAYIQSDNFTMAKELMDVVEQIKE